MSVATLVAQPDRSVQARFDLSVKQANLDAVRILSLLRTRGYRLERFELRPPKRCHVWVRLRSSEVAFLHARLERLVGVTVDDGTTWGS